MLVCPIVPRRPLRGGRQIPQHSKKAGSHAWRGAAWTLLYPDFSLVVPKPALFRPVGYAVARGNDELLEVFNAWLVALKSRGRVDELYRYWMLGEAAETVKPPRGSVIRNVLHWVD